MTLAMQAPEILSGGASLRLISAEEFRRMGETGILRPDERVELIEGGIYRMTPIGHKHMWLVLRLAKALERGVAPPMAVTAQGAMELDAHTQIQPDLMILKAEPKSLDDPLPGARDVLLAVEVADASLAHDRKLKLPLYARSGVTEVWVVDVAGAAIETHREPTEAGYRSVVRHGAGQLVAPLCAPDCLIDPGMMFS